MHVRLVVDSRRQSSFYGDSFQLYRAFKVTRGYAIDKGSYSRVVVVSQTYLGLCTL